MKRRILSILAAAVCFLLAVGIMLYPAVSSYVNEKYRSEIHIAYVDTVDNTDFSQREQMREAAVAYNKAITPGATTTEAYSQEAILAASEDYDSLLNLTGDGTMGYVEIPSIDVHLPIYHGTESDSLEQGVGHLLGSSLPVGGESTHAILTGHSGMASERMFTDLHELQIGDIFYIYMLAEVLAYQVCEICTVEPYDTTYLGIVSGEDLCTLVTCTPIGVNTHRLLVRGERIPYEAAVEVQQEQAYAEVETGSSWQNQYYLGIGLGIAGVLVMGIILYLRWWIRRWIRRSWRGKYVRKD